MIEPIGKNVSKRNSVIYTIVAKIDEIIDAVNKLLAEKDDFSMPIFGYGTNFKGTVNGTDGLPITAKKGDIYVDESSKQPTCFQSMGEYWVKVENGEAISTIDVKTHKIISYKNQQSCQ